MVKKKSEKDRQTFLLSWSPNNRVICYTAVGHINHRRV